ncbi:MAG: ABC transporter ATP-binding protein [Exilispira sp.]|jgi:putative ABC transport system ATP-binding protein|nr:ABC transporter ATP-binding protein [Exilispira sp.]
MENSNRTLIEVIDLTKVYGTGDSEVIALDNVNLKIYEGDFIAIIGASGSGKSTFMNILGTLDVPTSGKYLFNNMNVEKMDDDMRSKIRSKHIGFVFQSFNLVKTLNAVENVELPLFYLKDDEKGKYRRKRTFIREKAISILKDVGLGNRIYHRTNQLSGGQQQRIAIARALINDPDLILADEPTGNLDSKTSLEIMDIFTNLHKNGKTIVLVTHEHDIASFARKIVEFKDGKILDIRENI